MKESTARVLAFKRKSPEVNRRTPAPTLARVQKISRQLWEFGEQVRLETIKRQVQA